MTGKGTEYCILPAGQRQDRVEPLSDPCPRYGLFTKVQGKAYEIPLRNAWSNQRKGWPLHQLREEVLLRAEPHERFCFLSYTKFIISQDWDFTDYSVPSPSSVSYLSLYRYSISYRSEGWISLILLILGGIYHCFKSIEERSLSLERRNKNLSQS